MKKFIPFSYVLIISVAVLCKSVASTVAPTLVRPMNTGPAGIKKMVDLIYEVHHNHILFATDHEVFKVMTNNTYTIDSETKTAGLVTLLRHKDKIIRKTSGMLTSKGLRPDFYEEKRIEGGKMIRSATAHFDWEAKKLTLVTVQNEKSETKTVDLAEETLDWASSFYQFIFSPPNKKTVHLILTDGKRVEPYDYDFVNEALLKLTLGKWTTWHYERESENGNRKTEIWLAKDHAFIPVWVTQKEGESLIEQRLVKLDMVGILPAEKGSSSITTVH